MRRFLDWLFHRNKRATTASTPSVRVPKPAPSVSIPPTSPRPEPVPLPPPPVAVPEAPVVTPPTPPPQEPAPTIPASPPAAVPKQIIMLYNATSQLKAIGFSYANVVVGDTRVEVRPSGGGDDAAIVRDALARGNAVHLREGDYNFASEIPLFGRAISVEGDGVSLTRIRSTSEFTFRPVGRLEGITIRHMSIEGVGDDTLRQHLIGNSSGQYVYDTLLEYLKLSNANVLLSVGTHTSGECLRGRVQHVYARRAVGLRPGQGYGFHLSGAQRFVFDDCVADSCDRHSFYCGWTPKTPISDDEWDVDYLACEAWNHRKEARGEIVAMSAAFVTSRSRKVRRRKCCVVNSYDVGSEISQSNDLSPDDTASSCTDILLQDNVYSMRHSPKPHQSLGEQMAGRPNALSNIRLENEIYETDESLLDERFGPDVMMWNGLDVYIDKPTHRHINCTPEKQPHALMILGDERTAPTRAYVDRAYLVNPTYELDNGADPMKLVIGGGLKSGGFAGLNAPTPFPEG